MILNIVHEFPVTIDLYLAKLNPSVPRPAPPPAREKVRDYSDVFQRGISVRDLYGIRGDERRVCSLRKSGQVVP